MGKASKWFREILRLKKPDSSSPIPTGSASTLPKEKRRWSFVKFHRQNNGLNATAVKIGIENDGNHAVVVPAGAVVTAISSGGCACAAEEVSRNGEEWAAVKIQSAFRGCLARRALRALKGLVKLQALVRGHIERKRTAQWLQKLQVFLRAQARARAGRAQILLNSSSSAKSSNLHLHGPATPEKFENRIRSQSMKHDGSSMLKVNGNKEKCWGTTDSWVHGKSWNRQRSSVRTCVHDDRNVRTMEMDSGKPHSTPKRRPRNLFQSSDYALASDYYSQSLTTTKDSTTHHSGPTYSCEVEQSYSPLKVPETEDSPQYFSASSGNCGSKRCPFSPSRSDGSRSFLSGYSEYPNYMACTESSKAKVRSLSAPKQRPQYERSGSSTRYSINGYGESRLSAQRASALHASFTSKSYPGSGRLDKLGMPAGYRY